MQKIRKELFPDIQYESETICTNGEDSPLVRVLEKEKYKGKIIVSGEGSIGKSTMLTDLRLRLLEKEKAYVYFNLRDLKAGKDDKNIIALINNYNEKDLIVILDSYDETSMSPDRYGNTPRKTAEDLIEYCAGNDKVALLVVGVRQGCKSTHEMRVEHGGFSATQGFQCNQENAEKNYLEFDKWAQERGFRIAKLQRFSDEKIDLILSERKGVSKELRELLKNTMFLSMFLEDPVLDWESATNEAKFIDKYFEEVFCNKLEYQTPENREIIKEKLFSTICDIGENVFNRFCQLGSKEVKFGNRTELNTFFKQEQRGTEWIITATQEKYLSYCVAKYLSITIEIEKDIGIIISAAERLYMLMESGDYINEGLYYTGQLIDKRSVKHVNDVLHKTEDSCLFVCLSFIMLGHYCGVIKYDKIAITRWPSPLFENNVRLKAILLPKELEHIDAAFPGCVSLEKIDVDINNRHYQSIDGNLYSKDGSKLIQYAIGKTEKIFKIPSMVKSIEKGAFEGCESLENILIPNGVEQIGNYAIAKCKALRKIVIPSRVKSIGWYAFQGCNALENITISNGVRFIDFGVFANCISLRSIIIPGSIKKIGTNAFAGCKSLEKVIILEGTEIIGKNAFDGCMSLRSILIPRSVEYIEDLAFRECFTYTEEQRFRDIYISLLMSIYDEKQFKKYPFFKKIDIGDKTYYQWKDGNLYIVKEDVMRYETVTAIYYGGTQKEWIEKKFYEQRELADAVIFFYREKQPNNKLGHYWHYDKDDNPVIWE